MYQRTPLPACKSCEKTQKSQNITICHSKAFFLDAGSPYTILIYSSKYSSSFILSKKHVRFNQKFKI